MRLKCARKDDFLAVNFPSDDDLAEDDPAQAADAKRAARATANRHWAVFRAALNHAFTEGRIKDDTPWRRVRPYKHVDAAREFYPTAAQVASLIAHCADDLRPLVEALALTGFRLQALTAAKVRDLDPSAGTLLIRRDKKHARTAALSTAALALLNRQAHGKAPNDLLFTKADGEPWSKSTHHRPFRAACDAAKLPREFIPYSLRHYYISRALLAGVNVQALALTVGTGVGMIERHYGKFIRSDVRAMLDTVKVHSPRKKPVKRRKGSARTARK